MKDTELQIVVNLKLEAINSSTVVDFSRISGGGNNRLFKAVTEKGNEFLVKEYFPDDRKRLQREYGALKFLHNSGFNDVPTPYFADETQNYAIYSFEKGSTADPKSFTNTEVESTVEFLNKLQSIKPEKGVRNRFLDALFTSHSLDEYADTVLFKFGKFEESLKSKAVHPKVVKLAESYPMEEIVRGTIRKLRNASSTKKLFKPIKDEDMRLSSVDFGPHNMIMRKVNKPCFIDFEYFGWDDPVKIVANFLLHEGSKDIPDVQKLHFLDEYRKQSHLPSRVIERVDIAIQLAALDWVSILLWGVAPDRVASKKFLDVSMNSEIYLDNQIGKIVHRIENLQHNKY